MRKRSTTLAKCTAYVAVLFAVADVWPWALDVSSPLPAVPGLPAVGSVGTAVVEGEAPESKAQTQDPSGTSAGVAVDALAARSEAADEPAVEAPKKDPRLPRRFRPIYPSGYVEGGEVAVAVPAADASIDLVLERELATLADGDCRDFGSWTEVAAVNVIPDGTCARYRTVVGEESGEQAVAVAQNVIRRDDTAPAPPRLVISEASENAHATAGTLYYRAGAAEGGTFTVAAVAVDPQSGVEQVAFPALGDTVATTQAGPEGHVTYEWSSSVAEGAPTEGIVVATNGAGSKAEAPLEMIGDADAPAGGYVSYVGGLHRDGSVDVAVQAGNDAVSGVDHASGVLEAQDARLTGGRCRWGWSPWHAAPDGSPGRAACVRFRYRASDNVGNEVTYTSGVVAKVVDEVRPTVALVAPGGAVSGTVAVTAEADDVGFGIAAVRLEVSRAGRCDPRWQTIATVTAAPYGAAWDTSSLAPGRYRLRAVVTDRAGNSTASHPVTVGIPAPVAPAPPADEGGSGDPPTAPDGDDEDGAEDVPAGETEAGDDDAVPPAPSADVEDAPPAETDRPKAEP